MIMTTPVFHTQVTQPGALSSAGTTTRLGSQMCSKFSTSSEDKLLTSIPGRVLQQEMCDKGRKDRRLMR